MALVPHADDSGDDAGPRPGPKNHRSIESPDVTWSEAREAVGERHPCDAPALAGAGWAVLSFSPGPFPAQ